MCILFSFLGSSFINTSEIEVSKILIELHLTHMQATSVCYMYTSYKPCNISHLILFILLLYNLPSVASLHFGHYCAFCVLIHCCHHCQHWQHCLKYFYTVFTYICWWNVYMEQSHAYISMIMTKYECNKTQDLGKKDVDKHYKVKWLFFSCGHWL
jgi:hypothetical protein